jgi:peptide deformylase
MPYRTIKKWPNSALKNKAEEVQASEIDSISTDLIDTLKVVSGAGLAAPQINILKNVLVLDTSKFETLNPDSSLMKEDKSMWVISNPQIYNESGEFEWNEACLSVPLITTLVKRKENISLSYDDVTGERKSIDLVPPLSLAVQHEADHLIGKTILDRVSSLRSSMYKRKIRKHILKSARESEYWEETEEKNIGRNKRNSTLSKQEMKKRRKTKAVNRKKT